MYFSASGIIAMVGSVLAEIAVRYVAQKTIYILGYAIMIVCFFLMYAFGLSTPVFIVLSCIWFFGLSFVNATQISMYSDGIDYGIYRRGVDSRLWLMSLTTIPPRIGNFGKALVVGIGLAAIGYTAQVVPGPEVIDGIRFLACIAPAIIMVIGLIVLLKWFTLSDTQIIEIRKELEVAGLGKGLEEQDE